MRTSSLGLILITAIGATLAACGTSSEPDATEPPAEDGGNPSGDAGRPSEAGATDEAGAPGDAGADAASDADAGDAGIACSSDADCRLYENSCEVCSCLVLGASEPDPECGGMATSCLVPSCPGSVAACVDGACARVAKPGDAAGS